MKKMTILLIGCIASFLSFSQVGTTWSNSGPVLYPTNVSGQINGIGRCTQIKFDPVSPTRLYATSASGGLWVSNNNGDSWTGMGTDFFPNTQCASVCIDYTNTNILYLGTGDPNYYSNGLGVYKSTNGGVSWTPSNSGINTGLIIEIIMDPNNHLNLLAATDNGIFKSTNAGASWTSVKNGGDFKAMVLKPNSADTLYAVTSNEVWRSLNFGATWQQITNGVTIPGGNGNGMRLAVSNADPNVVYVGMIADEGTILKSTDAGTSFTTVYNNPAQSLVGYDAGSSGQGDYNFGMTADPADANTVYVVAHCVWKSTDGGVNWTKLTDWYAGCHTDMHGIRVHPSDNTKLFNVNDGGIFLSTDGGTNWTPKSDGIAATEIYHSGQSQLDRNTVSIGTQDNGELYQSGSGWYTNRGGDWGSKVMFPYNEPDVVYYFENGNRRQVVGSEESYNLPFTPSNSMVLEFNRSMPDVAFSGLNAVYICTDITAVTPNWTQLGSTAINTVAINSSVADSSVLYVFGSNNTLYRCDNVFASSPTFVSYTSPASTNVAASIATIASDVNVVYVSCGSRVYRSANKGQNFTNISTGLPVGVNIIKIYHDEFSTDESVYLCTAKGVYYKNNTMTSWQNISYNLPTIADIREFMFYNPGNASSLLKVAYYGRGVWQLPINTSFPPAVDFVSDQQVVCPNTPIHFTDQSVSSNTITGWQWSFPGGTPSSSNLQNPTVTYATPGNYAVTLVATDANGNGTGTKTAYIEITNSQATPMTEDFVGAFPPLHWSVVDAGQDNVVWKQNLAVGGYGNSTESAYFDNFNNDVNIKRDELRTANYDLSAILTPKLTFDVAYARYGGGNFDSLIVLLSTDCGDNFIELYSKGGTVLATSPDDQNEFIPAANQWRTDTIDLSAYIGQTRVMFAFQNRGHYGNNIYLDNVNITGISTLGVQENKPDEVLIAVYPNPVKDNLQVAVSTVKNETYSIIVTDLLGKKVIRKNVNGSPGKNAYTIDVSQLQKGFYMVTVSNGKQSSSHKILVE